MLFTNPVEFEIPTDWWMAAFMHDFRPLGNSYIGIFNSTNANRTVSLAEIKPPTRDAGVRWFDCDRMIKILCGIQTGQALPGVHVHEPPSRSKYRYALRDGFHRFYASAAAGFSHIPAEVFPYFDIRQD